MAAALALLIAAGVILGLTGALIPGLLWLGITGVTLAFAAILAVLGRAWNDYQHPLPERRGRTQENTALTPSDDPAPHTREGQP